jgi:hypothetical protein
MEGGLSENLKTGRLKRNWLNNCWMQTGWRHLRGKLQARDFIVISDKTTKQKLAKAAMGQSFIM